MRRVLYITALTATLTALGTALGAASLSASLTACGAPNANYPYEQEPDPRKQEYIIGASDRLSIRVFAHDEFNTDIQVRPDGTITIAMIGDMKALDLTPTQLKDQIIKAVASFVKDKDVMVTVAVTEVNSYKVTVSGNVVQPGVFPSKEFLTVAEAVALAAGPNRFAKSKEAVVIRPQKGGGVKRIPINYEQIREGGEEGLRQNLVLIRGDTVFFP
ncbi:MAG: polysaccharide export protein [Polyangiaceae bacterium]|nr:polysaccharide export protein [Polyangiaceae bacterium]